MGRIGSGVRVSVSFQQKYPPGSVPRCPTAAENRVMTKGVVSGGVDLRLRRITSSPSQTLRRRLVRTTDDGRRGVLDTRRRPSRLYFSHFATRTVDNTVDLYAAKAALSTAASILPPWKVPSQRSVPLFIHTRVTVVCMKTIFVQNRVFCLLHLHSTPPPLQGRFPSEYRHPVWHGKTRMAWLPDGEKVSNIFLFVLTQLTNVTNTQTDTA